MDVLEEPDWPDNAQTHLFAALDDAAHCSICRDFFNTPLSLLCGHSFCAECLRGSMGFQERNNSKAFCPQCREPADSRQIHANHPLRDLVKQYMLARPQLIAAVTAANSKGTGRPSKARGKVGSRRAQPSSQVQTRSTAKRGRSQQEEAVIDLETASEPDVSARKTRRMGQPQPAQPLNQDDSDSAASTSSESASEESDASSSSADPTPRKRRRSTSGKPQGGGRGGAGHGRKLPKNWGECPLCSEQFPMAILNDHVTKCLEANERAAATEQAGGGAGSGGRQRQKPKLVVPPKLLMAIEKDRSLRERLKKYGLSNKGTRQELEQRYARFRLEVQTALDRSETSATYAKLARRVMGRETTELNAGGPALSKKPTTTAGADFDDLIKATRARAGEAAKADACQANGLEEAEEPCQPDPGANGGPCTNGNPQVESDKGKGFRRTGRTSLQPTGDPPPANGHTTAVPLVPKPAAQGAGSPPMPGSRGRGKGAVGNPWEDEPDEATHDDGELGVAGGGGNDPDIIEDTEDEEGL